MKKILGILGLLLAIFVVTWIVEPKFASAYNLQNIIRWTSLFGIISIGVAFVIITGGIDLSIGSLIGLVGCLLPMLLAAGYAPALALVVVVALSLAIGLMHGLLITRLGLQPFVVTLCGLLFYRGFARWLTHDQVQGFGSSYEGLRQLAIGKVALGGFALPIPFFLLVLAGILAALFLNRTIWGRYLLALGRNETAARYSGIQIERMKILAMSCARARLAWGVSSSPSTSTRCNRPHTAISTSCMRLPRPCWGAVPCAAARDRFWGSSLARPSCGCSTMPSMSPASPPNSSLPLSGR